LIFPKAFEERNFLACCHKKKYLIRKERLANTECFLIYWPLNEARTKCCLVRSIHITQSDIQFTLRLVTFISALERKYHDKHVLFDLVLCGSCGGNTYDPKDPTTPTRIGDVLEIEEAIKFDRGEMWLTEEVIPNVVLQTESVKNATKGKHYMMSTKKDEPYLRAKSAARFHSHKATAICSNYIMNIPPHKLVNKLEMKIAEGVKTVVDMETFDFFSVCIAFGICHFRAMRVISDLESPAGDNFFPPDPKRDIRKNVPMDNLLSRLYHHLSWFHIDHLQPIPGDDVAEILRKHSDSELTLPGIDVNGMIIKLYGMDHIPQMEDGRPRVGIEDPVPNPIDQNVEE